MPWDLFCSKIFSPLLISALRFESVAWCRTARLRFSFFTDWTDPTLTLWSDWKVLLNVGLIGSQSTYFDILFHWIHSVPCFYNLYINKVGEITISRVKYHDALIYPCKVLLCDSCFPILQGSILILICIVLSFFPMSPNMATDSGALPLWWVPVCV